MGTREARSPSGFPTLTPPRDLGGRASCPAPEFSTGGRADGRAPLPAPELRLPPRLAGNFINYSQERELGNTKYSLFSPFDLVAKPGPHTTLGGILQREVTSLCPTALC